MTDYYAILGLEPGAPRESIKNAFRRLALQTHPDFQTTSGENEELLHSRKMAQLNEAYSVLYDVERRRLYDDQLRMQGLLKTKQGAAAAKAKTTATNTAPRTHTPPRPAIDHNIVKEFSDQLHRALLTKYKNLSWKEHQFDGFDWALEASSWSSNFWVGHRAFDPLNSSAVKSLINYAEIAIARHKTRLRKSHFLFLLPFQQLREWEAISVQCQRFVAAESRVESARIQTGILFLDVQHARALRFADTKNQGKLFRELIEWVSARI